MTGALQPFLLTEAIAEQSKQYHRTTPEERNQGKMGTILQNYDKPDWIHERAILAPKNESVTKLNLQVQGMLPGNGKSYDSIDIVMDPSGAVNYPTEFLNPLNPPGFKRLHYPVRLAFAMTINKAQGQCLRVAGINLEQPCFSHGQLYVACSRVGSQERLFILSPEGKTKNIVYQKTLHFKRLHYPVRLAFAMTINKAQGQCLRVAGINLEQPCFSHGQLYVACSRVGSQERLFILSPEGKTKNIVYQKALR
ncbi:uncharacterized protein LOC135217572 [Macrobrachium nipponense]|uniref:uncharacterized protein LOC135217572 n=1 Tax=Macrobrachium nipponense TaxID=159736 RepID=UPI0030C8C913